jgi:uncharacterized protein YjbI with pentapeptide repeats
VKATTEDKMGIMVTLDITDSLQLQELMEILDEKDLFKDLNFSEVDFKRCNFENSTFEESDFDSASFKGSTFEFAYIEAPDFGNALFKGGAWDSAHFMDVEFQDCHFTDTEPPNKEVVIDLTRARDDETYIDLTKSE